MRTLRELVSAGWSLLRAFLVAVVRPSRIANWGATDGELAATYTADAALPDPDIRWFRAITIDAPASEVWPWLAQLGRGAGYYAFDLLDNGGKPSASHLLDLPAPAVGDRNPSLGEVVAVDDGREIVWKTDPIRFLGAPAEMVASYTIVPVGEDRCRAVTLMLANARGPSGWLAKGVFAVMDYVMAPQQLRGLKDRAEGTATLTQAHPCEGPPTHQRDAIDFARTSTSDDSSPVADH